MSNATTFKALRVFEEPEKVFRRRIVERAVDDLPEGEVLVRVHYSALNYKDALSATGNKGVTRNYPHTPGIDASGIVEASSDSRWKKGEEVIVTGFDLGMNTDGGMAEFIRVPADWLVAKPSTLSLKDAMIIGTAGFTAGIGLYKMERMGQRPEQGPVLVTGASGGVGSLAVAILAKAGYEVVASTGKKDAYDYLMGLGASECIGREEVDDHSGRPLLRPKWAGAIDTVGGNTLTTILKTCRRGGNISACGLVDSPNLSTTVFPFILNGVNLLGIDSATCPGDIRKSVWGKLAGEWKIPELDPIATSCTLETLDPYIDQILAGKTSGRIIIKL